jgi:phospholipase/lecithinase/hemolysin
LSIADAMRGNRIARHSTEAALSTLRMCLFFALRDRSRPWLDIKPGGSTMTSLQTKTSRLRLVAALLTTLLVAACSGDDTTTGAAPVVMLQDGETAAAASQVAAGGPEAAQAVAKTLLAPRMRQVVVFGDSLSDVGTYRVGNIAAAGGGKFTTNPGPVWPETIGLLLGAPVTPFREGFAGQSRVLGGTGFAMGGSRVSQQPGIECHPHPDTGACTAALTIPVTQQIDDYLAANGDRFSQGQLVFVFAGGNDILFQLAALDAKVRVGVPLDVATLEAMAAVRQAATDLVGQVHHILGKGATRVAVLNLPELADTIYGKAAPAPVRELMIGMVRAFNGTLAAGLQGSGANLFDTYAHLKRVVVNPGMYFVTELNTPACDAAKISQITQGQVTDGSSLFCSPLTLVQDSAPIRYLFADDVHPTTLGHLILARFVLIELWRQRLL